MATGTIFIENDDTHDLFVTLYDLNTAGSSIVTGWNDRRLNDDDTEPATVTINGDGEAKIKWTATNTDDNEDTYTEEEESVDEGSTLSVHS